MQNSHLLHSFLETVQLHFENHDKHYNTKKYQPLKNTNNWSQNDGWAKLANVTINNNICQVFISYKQEIQRYDTRGAPVNTVAVLSK